MRRWAVPGLVLGLLAACGSPSAPSTSATSSLTASGTPASATVSSTAPGSAPASTATGPAPPGTAYEHGPKAGQRLAVVGVAAGSTLAVQDQPGTGGHRLAALKPLAAKVIATGRARLVNPAATAPSGARPTVWAEVRAAGVTGWADAGHLATPGHTTDLTAEVIERLGHRPAAETMLDLGRAVAQAYVSGEPPSEVTVSVAPSVGDLGEITLDVVGLGDDSVAAQRLHVFGTPGVESFTLKSVEGTPFCSRGVSAAGRCL